MPRQLNSCLHACTCAAAQGPQISSDAALDDITLTAAEVNFNRLDGTVATTLTAITNAIQTM